MEIRGESCGVIYVAFGYEYLIMALNSYRSLKKTNEDIPATIITNIEINNSTEEKEIKESLNLTGSDEIFDKVHKINDNTENNRLYKTNVHKYSPYDRSLYLDSDMEVKDDIKKGFRMLDYFDIAMTLSPYPVTTMADSLESDMHVNNIELKNSSRWNGGMCFFDKSPPTRSFFDMWNEKYEEFGYERDQYSLLHAAYNTSVRILSLDLSWNANEKCREFDEDIESNLKIYHYSHPPINKLVNFEKKIGKHILDYEENKINKIRMDFSANMKKKKMERIKNKIKGRLSEYSMIRKPYYFLKNMKSERFNNE